MESGMCTPARFFGPIMKKVIIQSIWGEKDDLRDDLSFDLKSAWDDAAPRDESFKKQYESGHVSRQFAEAMKPYENDAEAWEAVKIFYESGHEYT